jgi:hypothetical protein
MPEAAASPLPAWESFYVIVGSAAAVLTGLVFIVITLVPERRSGTPSEVEPTLGAFATPSAVHLCGVLFIAAVLSAPWEELSYAGLLLAAASLVGMTYAAITLRRLRHQTNYQPEMEDWVWYGVVPFVAYPLLAVAALLLPRRSTPALFTIATVALVLLFLGIRNTWDMLTFNALMRLRERVEQND